MNLKNIFFPKTCVLCQEKLMGNEEIICLHCENQLPYTHFSDFPNNNFEKKFYGRIPIESATSLLFFKKQGYAQKLIHQLKYRGKQKIGSFLGEKLGIEMRKSNRFSNLDAIIMVPLHPKKQRIRGYNQLTFFARQLAVELQIPVLEHVLIKTEQSDSQTRKSRMMRFEKLKENFYLQHPEKIQGLHILLVDDVFTTGATLEACAQELLKAGNVKLSFATMAIPAH